MIPSSFEDMIAEDNRCIVEGLNTEKLGLKYAKPKTTGRKPYNPTDLLKLYIYEYFNGIRNSRKLEKECKKNIEVMWLINELTPDDKTIFNFRKDNKKALNEVISFLSLGYVIK
ncbi:IS1182 family transposase [Abyssisolibacter fermentans]|uniref:IS1182 family transposase n=1 Tax=Abyssisolibacter fermentans TaxID=1766203 RepID=UPI0008311B0B|nr:IS1182 family transposase [Abyssisolibacter fermentans]